ncbi:MAG TPA: hypothetical protein VER03_12085 [Bryobacteraceae bacterium]|nr:hypothetical protein [Bryobacteraceae bacterium]
MNKPRTVVTFHSEQFNSTVVRPYFLNTLSFGDDVAQHIVYELRRRGYRADEPAQEDFGWYFRFWAGGSAHLFVIGRRPVEGDWLGSIERVPFLLLKRSVDLAAAQAIQDALEDREIFQSLRWHFAEVFDSGDEESGATSP